MSNTAAARSAPQRTRRLSTETKAAFKTTEFFAFIAVLAAILISAAVVDGSAASPLIAASASGPRCANWAPRTSSSGRC